MKNEFAGELWSQVPRHAKSRTPLSPHVPEFGLKFKYGARLPGLGKYDLHYGDNSGYQAINLAYLLGATKIVLLGYDMQMTGGKAHWHTDHQKPLNAGGSDLEHWAKLFPQLAIDLAQEGIEVVNCTRETALTCFKRQTIEAL